MSWYRLELKGSLDDVTDRAWREVWNAAYGDATYDPTNGIFRSARSGPCTLYFSPAAAELATTFGATRCKKPSGERLVFIAGPSAARELHFPSAGITQSTPRNRRVEQPRHSQLTTQPPSMFASTLAP